MAKRAQKSSIKHQAEAEAEATSESEKEPNIKYIGIGQWCW